VIDLTGLAHIVIENLIQDLTFYKDTQAVTATTDLEIASV
jgi:hypothetical protein